MAKMQGFVRSVPVSPDQISEGSHVYWNGCPSKVKLWYVREVKDNGTAIISPNIVLNFYLIFILQKRAY